MTNPPLTVQDADADLYTHVGQKPGRIVNFRVDTRTDTFGYLVNPIESGACTAGVSATLLLYQFVDTIPRERTVLSAVCPDSGSVVVDSHYTTGLLFGAGSSIVVGGFRNFVDIQGYLVPAD